jgi:hypothetical protein
VQRFLTASISTSEVVASRKVGIRNLDLLLSRFTLGAVSSTIRSIPVFKATPSYTTAMTKIANAGLSTASM